MEHPCYRPSDKLIFSKRFLWSDVNPTDQTKNYSPVIFASKLHLVSYEFCPYFSNTDYSIFIVSVYYSPF